MRFLHSFAITLTSQGIILVFGFLNGIVITRNLGPVGRGEYAMINFMVTVLLVIFGEGVYRSTVYLTSRDKSDENISTIGSNVIFYGLLITIILAIFVLLPNSWYQVFLPGIKTMYIYLGFGTALFFIFIRQLQGLFLGLQKFWRYNLMNVLRIVFFLTFNLSILLFLKGLTTIQVLLNFLISMLVTCVIGMILFYRRNKPTFTFHWNLIYKNITYGLRATFAYLMIFLLIRMNLFIVNYMEGLEEAGLFAVAVNIATLIQRVPNVAGSVLMPKVSEQSTQNKLVLTTKAALVAAVFSISIAMLFYLAGEQLIVFLYKEDFAPSFRPLMWLMPGIILFSITSIYNTAIWGRGFPPISIWGPFIALLVNIGFCFLLIPGRGIVGAAQAATISYVVFSIIVFLYILLIKRKI